MTDAPRTILAWGSGRKLSLLGGSPDFQHLYHHDAVVRELVEAADALVNRWDSPAWGGSADNLRHTGEYIDALRAALAKIAQE